MVSTPNDTVRSISLSTRRRPSATPSLLHVIPAPAIPAPAAPAVVPGFKVLRKRSRSEVKALAPTLSEVLGDPAQPDEGVSI
jgi:hypothetical protein